MGCCGSAQPTGKGKHKPGRPITKQGVPTKRDITPRGKDPVYLAKIKDIVDQIIETGM